MSILLGAFVAAARMTESSSAWVIGALSKPVGTVSVPERPPENELGCTRVEESRF